MATRPLKAIFQEETWSTGHIWYVKSSAPVIVGWTTTICFTGLLPILPMMMGSSIVWLYIPPEGWNRCGGGCDRKVTTSPPEMYQANTTEAPWTYLNHALSDFLLRWHRGCLVSIRGPMALFSVCMPCMSAQLWAVLRGIPLHKTWRFGNHVPWNCWYIRSFRWLSEIVGWLHELLMETLILLKDFHEY